MRVYSANFDQVSISAAQDVFSIKASSTVPCKLLAIYLGQSSKATDANNAQQRWQIRRGQTSQGSGGSTITPRPVTIADTASGVTAHANDTTQANTGTITILHDDVFNIEAGLIWIATERYQFEWSAATCLTVEFPAIAVTATYNGTIYFCELAG
jgi:hypothetical protein